MAHYQQLRYVELLKACFPDYFNGKKVLEIGSWDANGSVRKFFVDCDYLGLDVAEGPGVDIVLEGQYLDYPDESFDVVLACECFEHNKYWNETFKNMIRMLKRGGLLFFSCATLGREEHGTSRMHAGSSLTVEASFSDYYRNLSKSDFLSEFDFDELFAVYQFNKNIYFKDLYFWGIKKSDSKIDLSGISAAIKAEVNAITCEGGCSSAKNAKKFLSYYVKYFISRLVGEKLYHNAKYNFRRVFS